MEVIETETAEVIETGIEEAEVIETENRGSSDNKCCW